MTIAPTLPSIPNNSMELTTCIPHSLPKRLLLSQYFYFPFFFLHYCYFLSSNFIKLRKIRIMSQLLVSTFTFKSVFKADKHSYCGCLDGIKTITCINRCSFIQFDKCLIWSMLLLIFNFCWYLLFSDILWFLLIYFVLQNR